MCIFPNPSYRTPPVLYHVWILYVSAFAFSIYDDDSVVVVVVIVVVTVDCRL